MAHEFGYAFGQRADEFRQIAAAITPCKPETRKPIRRTAMMTCESVVETPAHQPHDSALPSDAARL